MTEKKTKIDKTKENIKVSNLDIKEKKELFDRFLQAGGEVVREQPRKGLTEFNREKQRNRTGRIDTQRYGQKTAKTASPEVKPAPSDKNKKRTASPQAPAGRINPIVRFFHRLHIRFRLFFMGISDFYGLNFSPKFLDKLNGEVKTNLLEIQLLYLDIFKKNHQDGIKIIKDLDRLNPLYYELLEMISSVFDRTVINRIIEHHLHFPNVEQKTTDIRDPLMELFKKLYVLYPYHEFILSAFEKAVSQQMKIEKEKQSVYSLKRKKIKNDLYFVLHKFTPALYWLFNHYNGFVIPMNDPMILSLLGISENDMPGKRERLQMRGTAEESMDGEQSKNTEVEEEQIPEDVKRGMELMNSLDLSQLKSRIDRNGVFKFVKDNDKILLAHMLFIEFDEEFSFILTTSKIKYNVLFTQEGKIDHRTRLSDLYNELRKTMNVFKDYADVLTDYEKTRLEKPTSSSQYMDYSNRLTGIDKKRNTIGKNIRMAVRSFMEKIAEQLKILIDDMNGPQKIIENPQEELVFDSSIEGNKRLNGAKVYSAITTAYNYAAAYIYRLGPGGDLFGELEFNEQEMENLKSGKSLPSEKTTESGSEEKKEPGIINELEDLF